MNAQAHRLIFNTHRGCLMAVADTATSAGKSNGLTRRKRCTTTQATPTPATRIASTSVQLRLPTSSLYRINANPSSRILVETDPAFTNYKTWLSSDYITSKAALDPSATQKRLGDGFYEQQLIREQVANLTGQRFLGDYTNDQAQYQALMDAGLTFASAHNLRPGVALSAAQVAMLTSDIVWLEPRTITLADGSSTQVLVPRVYAALRDSDLAPTGAVRAMGALM